ncbi:hypothetical protein [Sulfurisphaera ohwakuensis]|uniref:Energy-coupling factor transport system substrate-specific component n=1 Tax=Sulfurisphaera ohwakuensis TaxID=69656 RepID=A0A650CFH7_SULOH|nr:hypothetical protein [Sulfurisphaera ohwakuensis]MBB5255134.1 hypothetical protein [Sulfurisphaera ohwakuensis]QGR16613.1 hypothetical protein D1869_04945 [Sulfurisphaera ohwakuensis]
MFSLEPGITPLPIVVGYFIVVTIVAFFVIKRSKNRMKLMDYVIAAIGGAIISFADHVIGDAIFLPSPIYPFINPPVWFRILVFFIVVGVIRKVGAGMLSMGVFDIVSDLLHFGFSGEPLWLIEDILTYGLMADITIYVTQGRIFGIGEKNMQPLFAIFEGGVLGFVLSFVHPFFTYGFIAPIVFGFVPSQARIEFLLISYIPGDVVIGAISALIANRIARVVRSGI